MQLKISKQRIALASVASIVWVLQGLGNMSSGQWSKPTGTLFVILAPVLTFIVAVAVNVPRQGLFGPPAEKRQAVGQFRTTVVIWVVVALIMLVGFKVVHWYQTP